MKYGMNMLLWTTDVTEEHYPLLEQIKGWGYDGVEVPIFDTDLSKYEKLSAKLDELELERTAVTISTGEANPISPDSTIRQAAVDNLKKVVDVCAALKVDKLCGPFHSALGEFSGAGPTEEEWTHGIEVLRTVADHGKEKGVTLVCEYLNRFECYFINCAADAAKLVRDCDHSNIRTMYDTFHANIEEASIADAIRACADESIHVHISENNRATPGEGNVDWKTNFDTLKEINYDGWMVVEAFGLALPDLAAATKIWRRMYSTEEELATKALSFMKENWEG